MGQTQSSSKYIGSLNRFPQLQNDLRKIYKHFNPGKTRRETIEWATKLNNETRIRTVVEEFEIEVFGRDTETGKPNVGGGHNLIFRTGRLKRKLNLS